MTIVGGAVTFGVALIPGIVGLMLLYMSLGGAGTSACPVCAAPLAGLSTKANHGVLCGGCHNYVEGKGRLLWQTVAGQERSHATATPTHSGSVLVPFT